MWACPCAVCLCVSRARRPPASGGADAGVKPGDEVIVPALTFIASRTPPSPVWALSRCSFGCDETATMDPDAAAFLALAEKLPPDSD